MIGSGIEAVGFTAADEMLIRDADEVFFCVADPATSVWIKARRPDAYDLYVLYDDSKLRYLTYMQMTEAMLHYVRQGRRVVAIFYGHPGIFVLSTHRAVIIARREGHRAIMRAAVSAWMPCAPISAWTRASQACRLSRRPTCWYNAVASIPACTWWSGRSG